LRSGQGDNPAILIKNGGPTLLNEPRQSIGAHMDVARAVDSFASPLLRTAPEMLNLITQQQAGCVPAFCGHYQFNGALLSGVPRRGVASEGVTDL
jgi:hypothetical protein